MLTIRSSGCHSSSSSPSVAHVNTQATDGELELLWQSEDRIVNIPVDCLDRREPTKLPQDAVAPDIAGVQQEFRSMQGCDRLCTEQRVRIGDQANEHG